MPYETVIGLEVHTELRTQAKMFCRCANQFGGAPNTRVCPLCSDMPGGGERPALNPEVVALAIRAGLAMDCTIAARTSFDRKHYTAPDLPKGYQITQCFHPICRDGRIGRINVRQIHMEEDAGKVIYDAQTGAALVDFNRSGVPLLEIVTQPDLRSAAEAVAYVESLREILLYTGVSDCKMQEGSLRVDVNISVRPMGCGAYGVRTEMKNLNSLRAVARAIEHESARQIALLERGESVLPETRRWDDAAGESRAMRAKETAADYRYCPAPDLPAMAIDPAMVDGIRAALPELPEAKRRRFIASFGLSAYEAKVITAAPELARLFEGAAECCGDAREAAHWVMGEASHLLQKTGTLPEAMALEPEALGRLITLMKEGAVTREAAKSALAGIFDGGDPETYIRERGLAIVSDGEKIRTVLVRMLAENEKAAAEYRNGKEKAMQFLIGQGMRALGGRVPAAEVKRALQEMFHVKHFSE